MNPLLLAALLLPAAQAQSDPSKTIGGDHPRLNFAASTCVTMPCTADPIWGPARAADDDPASAWSSRRSPAPAANEWYAVWFDDFRSTDYIRFRPRMVQGRATHVPERITIHYYAYNRWNPIQTVTLNANMPATGQVINFPAVHTGGILITTDRLRSDGAGNYYFQLAELYAGTTSCNGFTDLELPWCIWVSRYYRERSLDTDYIQNANVRIGANASFGGTVFELYGADRGRNLIFQHGGGALQLSLYGYHRTGPTLLPVTACTDLNPHPDHNPYNPIMAKPPGCNLWDGPTGANSPYNDLDYRYRTATQLRGRKTGPWQYTWDTSLPGLTWQYDITLGEAWARLEYHITYSGSLNLTEHPQELPALFTASGMGHRYYYYAGGQPYTHDPNVSQRLMGAQTVLRLPNRAYHDRGSLNPQVIGENWITSCDATETRCLTLATYSPHIEEFGYGMPGSYAESASGYVSPVGWFSIGPGLDKRIVVYVFPYKFDRVVAGKSIRQWIYDLRQ